MTDWPNNIEVRRWAQSQPWGHKVNGKGALSKQVIAMWNRAHPDRPYKASEAYHGTQGGYTQRNCRCDRCRAAAAARGRDIYAAVHEDGVAT